MSKIKSAINQWKIKSHIRRIERQIAKLESQYS